jgi:hypothetical protein
MPLDHGQGKKEILGTLFASLINAWEMSITDLLRNIDCTAGLPDFS